MKKKKQKKTDAAGKYTRPAAGPGGSGPGISSGPYGGAQQLPALQTIPFQPLQIQQEPMQPLPLAPGCERGASRGTKERTPADPAGICGATFEQSENGVASTLPPAGATTGQRGFAQRNGAERRQAPGWEPPLTDPEQPPRVQLLPYRPDPEQPPQVQRLPYRPDPARPPQVQLLQMQRSVLPYMGRAGKNSGAANWVEKLDWKTPSGAPYTSAPEQGGPSNRMELIMAQRGGGGGGFSPGAGAGRGDAPAPGTGVGGGFAGGGGGLWAGDEHAEQSWGDKALRWLDDNLFRPAGYLAEKYAGGAGKQAETLRNGMVTWGRAGAAGELQQDQLAAQQFAFLGGPWETHAQETEKANTAVTQALPQAAQGLRGDAMRDYAEGIDGRYGDPDGLLGWLGERADSAGQGLLSGAARILGVPGAGTAMDFLSTMENAAQQARENGAGEDEAFLYGLGEVVKRIGGQQLEEYFRSKAGELFTRGEVQAMSPREISENYDAIRESMEMWDENGELPEDEQGQPDAPTRPDEQMQPNAPELENAGETVYDEIDESLLAPGYENWTDLNRFMQTVLENPELSVEQRVQLCPSRFRGQ